MARRLHPHVSTRVGYFVCNDGTRVVVGLARRTDGDARTMARLIYENIICCWSVFEVLVSSRARFTECDKLGEGVDIYAGDN